MKTKMKRNKQGTPEDVNIIIILVYLVGGFYKH